MRLRGHFPSHAVQGYIHVQKSLAKSALVRVWLGDVDIYVSWAHVSAEQILDDAGNITCGVDLSKSSLACISIAPSIG